MPSNSVYPAELEQAWVQHAMQVTGTSNPRVAVERLAESAGFLSDAFTTGRDPDFSGYNSNRRSLAAYGLFFFPRAYERTRLVLRECRQNSGLPFSGSREIHIVDIGSGTGAAGLACLHELSGWLPGKTLNLDMVDVATEGINVSRTIFSAGHTLWPSARVNPVRADARTYQPEAGVDIILCSFAINEWMERHPETNLEDWVTRMVNALRPGGWLILLEPSLRVAVERMERLRNRVAELKIGRIIAPCPHHDTCPMLAEKRGWCHEVREWPVPESLRWINRNLQRDVHLLKFSFLVLENNPIPKDKPDWMRLVSPLRKEKGKYGFHGCGADGKIHACEWLTRNLTEEQKEASEKLERGDKVIWKAEQILGDGVTERSNGPAGRWSLPR
jgi:ribosomal protein RSM22 (predicted rRNA methylase)